MRKKEFETWLGQRIYQGQPLTDKAIMQRVRWAGRVERALPNMDSKAKSLDDLATQAGREWIDERFKLFRANPGEMPPGLVPEASDPSGQMKNLRNAAIMYIRFANGEDPNSGAHANTDFENNYHEFLLFDSAGQAYRPVPNKNTKTGRVAYRIAPPGGNNRTDEAIEVDTLLEVAQAILIEGKLARIAPVGGGTDNLMGYGKRKLVAYAIDPELADKLGIPAKGQQDGLADVLDRFCVASKKYFKSKCDSWSAEQKQEFRELAMAVHEAGLDWFPTLTTNSAIRAGRKTPSQKKAERVAIWFHTHDRSFSQAGGLVESYPDSSVNLRLGSRTADAFIKALRNERDDVRQWFPNAPARARAYWPDEFNQAEAEDGEAPEGMQMPETNKQFPPENLILYGPPGTGKTYATIAEAVRLCDGYQKSNPILTDPDRRQELRKRYKELVDRNRIRFVTFHQTFGYEDFVEGLRPETGKDSGGGFRLEARDGIFKEIAKLARANHGPIFETANGETGPSPKVFKVSLTNKGDADEEHLYQECLGTDGQGYISIRQGKDIDWSDARFDDFGEMKERWSESHPGLIVDGRAADMVAMYSFRINMEPNALVVIADGSHKFRAIGRIAGDYEYFKHPLDGRHHRRAVEWLWHGESLPVDAIYHTAFSSTPICQLAQKSINWRGIDQLASSGRHAPDDAVREPYVLIIDEINRANVSKVFGELITLIETDKREGMDEAITLTLPYSGEPFSVPANLNIIGTMNTADRSIARLDTALRRRFTFQELPPRPNLLKPIVDGIRVREVLETINKRIEYLLDREHRIGHAFFINKSSRDELDAVMLEKVIPLLQEYFFEDWGLIQAVLGKGFIKGDDLAAPADLIPKGGYSNYERISWSVNLDGNGKFSENAYDQLLTPTKKSSEEQPTPSESLA